MEAGNNIAFNGNFPINFKAILAKHSEAAMIGFIAGGIELLLVIEPTNRNRLSGELPPCVNNASQGFRYVTVVPKIWMESVPCRGSRTK